MIELWIYVSLLLNSYGENGADIMLNQSNTNSAKSTPKEKEGRR